MMERAFQGFAAIAPPNWKKPWREVFGDQHRPDQAVSFSHETEPLRDSTSCASRIRFPTGTSGPDGTRQSEGCCSSLEC
jgi:hypothetical protein